MSQVFFNLPRHTDGGKTTTAFTLNLPLGMGAVEYLLNAGPADESSQHQVELQLNHVEGAAPGGGVRVLLNGQPLSFDVAPVRVAGRLLVPLRTIAEALGAQVGWDEATRTVMLSRGESAIILVIGSQTALVDGAPVTLDAAPEIRDGRTLVPLRFVAESLGLSVEWDAPTQTAHLTSK